MDFHADMAIDVSRAWAGQDRVDIGEEVVVEELEHTRLGKNGVALEFDCTLDALNDTSVYYHTYHPH